MSSPTPERPERAAQRAPASSARISADRLSSMLFLAVLAHGVLILGVTFSSPAPPESSALPSLKVTLVVDTNEVDEPPPEADRVPIAESDKIGVIDPLSAFLIPGPLDPMARVGCDRTLAMFDGRRRYDLALSFKRHDAVKGEGGAQKMVLVCQIRFTPMSGHRASSQFVKFLAEGRDIEVWLVPVTGTRILAPVRLAVASLIGNMVLQADQFETTASSAAGK